MILFYINNKQKNHARMIKALYLSYDGVKHIEPTSKFNRLNRINNDADCIVIAGMIRGEGNIYKWCVENNKRFLYIDHAYLLRGYNQFDPENEWMRITDSGFVWNKIENRSSDRWNKYFASSCQPAPWVPNKGRNILALPPSTATQHLFPDSKKWMDDTLEKISQTVDWPIVVREKPSQVKLDLRNAVIGRIHHDHANTIDAELADARLVVTYNSAVAVQAAINGIPVLTSPHAAAYPMSQSIDRLRDPVLFNREPWLHQLVHHQFRTSEMMDGSIWNMLFGHHRP